GYTILPMRRPTTRITAKFIMGRFVKRKSRKRQRLLEKAFQGPSQSPGLDGNEVCRYLAI
ncbi:MAG: hypothetical protein ACREEJ_03135, partial [Ensifer adhaerens]